jgi:endonuclease I
MGTKYDRPSTMTRQQFKELAQTIRDNSVNETHTISVDTWETAAGNIYTRCDAGFTEKIVYAGVHYYLKYKYVVNSPSKCSVTVWEKEYN